MEQSLDLRNRVRHTVDSVYHHYDYARHLVRGNRFPGEMAWMREGSRPIVLVHGFLGTRGSMLPLTRRFQADGHVVFSYSYGTFQTASLRRSAQGLIQQLRTICDNLGVDKVDVVGFSMGGLVTLHALKFMQGHEYVRRVVTLGTPFGGTWVGLAGVLTLGAISPSVWQVLPGSRFLKDLADAPMPPTVKMRQIHGFTDGMVPAPGPINGVSPRDYIVLPGGHSTLVVAEHVYDAAHEFLAADDEALALPHQSALEFGSLNAAE